MFFCEDGCNVLRAAVQLFSRISRHGFVDMVIHQCESHDRDLVAWSNGAKDGEIDKEIADCIKDKLSFNSVLIAVVKDTTIAFSVMTSHSNRLSDTNMGII